MDKSQDAVSLYDVVTYAGYEWFVIGIDGERISLLAKNDDFGHRCFDENFFGYEDSEIRKYLNTVVLNKLLENGACLETIVLEDLEDRVYLLLSEREARDLPEYIRKFSNWWWIGSLGFNSYSAIYVDNDGNTHPNGILTTKESGSVRPAITVKVIDLLKSNNPADAKNDNVSIQDKALKLAEVIAEEVNHDPFLQSEPSYSKEVECCIEHWMYRDDEESAIEDDWIARQSRILDIFQSHGLLFKAIYPGFRRLAGYDTMTELVSSYLVFSHRVGSGVITAKVDKDRKISGGVTVFR